MRPFGALVFGRLGDMIGRKYTFLVTILLMGLSTFIVGILPTYASIGVAAPVVLNTLFKLALLVGIVGPRRAVPAGAALLATGTAVAATATIVAL